MASYLTYSLLPTKKQIRQLEWAVACSNEMFNWARRRKSKVVDGCLKPNTTVLRDEITKLKLNPDYNHLNNAPCDCLYTAIALECMVETHGFEFHTRRPYCELTLDSDDREYLLLQKIGEILIDSDEIIRAPCPISRVRVARTEDGLWFVEIRGKLNNKKAREIAYAERTSK